MPEGFTPTRTARFAENAVPVDEAVIIEGICVFDAFARKR